MKSMSKISNQSSLNDFTSDWWGLRLRNTDDDNASDQPAVVVDEDSADGLAKRSSQIYRRLNQICHDDADSNVIAGKDGWRASNKAADLSLYVLRNRRVFGQDPAIVDKAIFSLVHRIDEDLKTGQVLTSKQRDVVRQMSENAPKLMIAAVESTLPNDRKASKRIGSLGENNLDSLLHIASDNGANSENIRQLQKLADEIMSE